MLQKLVRSLINLEEGRKGSGSAAHWDIRSTGLTPPNLGRQTALDSAEPCAPSEETCKRDRTNPPIAYASAM